jgi:uncharacterized protein YjbI with pentapeptide repeats
VCWNDFVNCDFTGGNLSGADLRASVFKKCRFDAANLDGAELRGASFLKCTFSEASLKSAKLTYFQRLRVRLNEMQRPEVAWHWRNPEVPGSG